MGLFAALVTMSNTRLAMAIVPVMGRNHFFAIFSVFGNLSLGLAPILWGVLIDGIGHREVHWAGVDWNRYSIFFAASATVSSSHWRWRGGWLNLKRRVWTLCCVRFFCIRLNEFWCEFGRGSRR